MKTYGKKGTNPFDILCRIGGKSKLGARYYTAIDRGRGDEVALAFRNWKGTEV